VPEERLEFLAKKYPNPFGDPGAICFRGYYEFQINCTLDILFKTISNTSLLNRRLGFPKRYERERDGRLYVRTKFLNLIPTYWEERPWKWAFGKYQIADREHHVGVMRNEHAVFHVEPCSEKDHYSVAFYYEVALKSRLFKQLIAWSFPRFGQKLGSVVTDLAHKQIKHHTLIKSIGEQAHLLSKRLIKLGIDKKIAEFMGQLVYDYDDEEVHTIRLPKYTALLGCSLDKLLESFLIASKADFFELCWDVICPHCKGPRSRNTHLRDLLFTNECGPCQLTFTLDEIEHIDATFRIRSRLRDVQNISYCVGEPFRKQHILFQGVVTKGGVLHLEFDLPERLYRARIQGRDSTLIFETSAGEGRSFRWNCQDSATYSRVGQSVQLEVHNEDDRNHRVSFEALKNPQHHLSPLTLFNNQTFRTLYRDQNLAAGVQLKLPEQLILFTDVVGSTNFYSKVGDREAYRQIQVHFEIVSEAIGKVCGIIIKTIGDCVMATFPTFDHLLTAIRDMNLKLAASPDVGFELRYSAHKGEVIAVNYNTGIDYFGNNVNIAAKLQAISNANELSLSKELYETIEDREIEFEQRCYLDKVGYVMPISSAPAPALDPNGMRN
jgi:class 3 adenylate cyclase